MTRLSRLLPAAALLAGLGVAGIAAAQEGPMPGFGRGGPHGPGMRVIDFAAIDANGDASLDRAELLARSAARLSALDLDSDGALDRAELIAAFPAPNPVFDVFTVNPAEGMADRMIAMHGGTAEGRVAVSVLSEAQVNRLLTRLDTDRDDAISAAEAEARMDRHGGRGGPDGHRRGPRS